MLLSWSRRRSACRVSWRGYCGRYFVSKLLLNHRYEFSERHARGRGRYGEPFREKLYSTVFSVTSRLCIGVEGAVSPSFTLNLFESGDVSENYGQGSGCFYITD